uniref:Uncharacterized protein n=1 Tax=viral metagenome TaxID=1070528 RepID=A0A6C0EMF5_9ZZZZ
MFKYNDQGKKMPMGKDEVVKKVRFANTREGYNDKKKSSKWVWYVVGGVGLLVLILLLMMWWKKRKYGAKAGFGYGSRKQRFGFRFY